MTEVPPPRWRVVERGRRLEVIDTQAGGVPPLAQPVMPRSETDRIGPMVDVAARPGMSRGRRSGLPRTLRFDGTLGWTTHPFYDGNGPRAVALGGGTARRIGGATVALAVLLIGIVLMIGAEMLPAMVVAVVIALSNWKQVKPWLTRRLDGIAVQ